MDVIILCLFAIVFLLNPVRRRYGVIVGLFQHNTPSRLSMQESEFVFFYVERSKTRGRFISRPRKT